MTESAPNLGLYLSIPFCRAKCSFCNFASGVGTGAAVADYIALLCEELQAARSWAEAARASLPEHVDTIYFGGGTPSLLEPEQLKTVLHAVRQAFVVDPSAEITMEAAPNQIGDALLEVALAAGVNRISLGVQTFVDREAQAVGRSHTAQSCLQEYQRLRRAGVTNLGADLIAGLPYQTEASWEQSLAIASEAGLEHLSVYMLEVDEDSRLGREVLSGGARLHAPAVASDDLTTSLYERACETLPRAGYAQYEISNFAQPGRQSRHNLKYWTRAPYLGLGLDAHSMLAGKRGGAVRWANPDELKQYRGAQSERDLTLLTERDGFEEEIFLGLRLLPGVRWDTLQRHPASWREELASAIAPLCREGLMGSNPERFWLTARGRIVSGEIFGELLAGVPA